MHLNSAEEPKTDTINKPNLTGHCMKNCQWENSFKMFVLGALA